MGLGTTWLYLSLSLEFALRNNAVEEPKEAKTAVPEGTIKADTDLLTDENPMLQGLFDQATDDLERAAAQTRIDSALSDSPNDEISAPPRRNSVMELVDGATMLDWDNQTPEESESGSTWISDSNRVEEDVDKLRAGDSHENPQGDGSGVAALQAQINRLEVELDTTRNKMLRALADYDNYRRRVTREKEDTVLYGNEKILCELLPTLDNLELALEQEMNSDGEKIIDGIKMINQQIHQTLSKFNLESFESLNQPFDPVSHEALGEQPHNEVEAGTVVTVVKRGYRLNDRLLRPAMVIVSVASTDETAPSESDAALEQSDESLDGEQLANGDEPLDVDESSENEGLLETQELDELDLEELESTRDTSEADGDSEQTEDNTEST
jgi:molecular chaperone GrpE